MDILVIVAVIWLAAASFTDLKKREVANWLSFSLLVIALAAKAAESVISWSLEPLAVSLLGFSAFFILANLLYYGRIFAGGDAKLLMALGAIMPSAAFLSNMLFVGSAYGLIYSAGLGWSNRIAVFREMKKSVIYPNQILIFLIALFLAGLMSKTVLIYLAAAAAILMICLQAFVRAIENSCLIKKIPAKRLTEGDWLFKDVVIRGKMIKARFQGLTKREISLLRKSKKEVYVKYGIPFIPVFFIAFLITAYFGNLLFLLL